MSKQIVVRSKPPYTKNFYHFNGNEELVHALSKGYIVKFVNKIIIDDQECLEYILEGDDI